MGRVPAAPVNSGHDWVNAMRAGNFVRAWEISDRHLRSVRDLERHTGPRHQQVIWRGEELAGKHVLVRCYHGLGDTIQFLRFMPALRRVARTVTLFCQPSLLSIVARAEGVDRVLPLHDGSPETCFDVDIEIMEISHALRVDRSAVAMDRPYLTANEQLATQRFAGGLSIGLVWEVGNWDKRRCIPYSLFKQLDMDGVQLYSLQLSPAAGAIDEIGAIDVSTPDIEILAARLKQLDLLICVDTMVAHLACALGCETWILLHSDCDWRWPSAGNRSLWYPTARLFHQSEPGDWDKVMDSVAASVKSRLSRSADAFAVQVPPQGRDELALR